MEINICFGLNDSYSQHAGATIASILSNANPQCLYNFFIITDSISKENKEKFEKLKSIHDFNIQYFEIDSKEFENIKTSNNIGIATFFRLKIFDLIKADKVLYLDCDTIVRKDITKMYITDISDYYCAAVEDVGSRLSKEKVNLDEDSTYFNAGVILFNLKLCRKDDIKTKIFNVLSKSHETTRGFSDQDALNIVLQKKVKFLDIKWNNMFNYRTFYDKAYYYEVSKDPSIIHYITDQKPWKPDAMPHKKEEYFIYIQKTPWYDDFIKNYTLKQNDLILKNLIDLNRKMDELKKMQEIKSPD